MGIESNESLGNDIDIDSLVDGIENQNTNTDIPMNSQGEEPSQVQAQAPMQEFEVAGKKVAWNDPRVKQWLEMGHNYGQQKNELNQKMSAFEKAQKDFQSLQERYKPYEEVNKFATDNPEWWKSVEQAWQNRQNAQLDPNNPLTSKISVLEQELNDFKQFKQSIQEKEKAVTIEQEDQALNTDIDSIRKEYPTIDFDATDEEGKTLVRRVLEFAAQKGIPDYKTAFIAHNHERLVQLKIEEALAAKAKNGQALKKAGILSKTSVPTKEVAQVQNHKNKDYNDIHNEILEEFGLSS